jgi:hypothetical protein
MATTVPAQLKRIHSTDRTVTQIQENTRTALESHSAAIAGCLQAQHVIPGISFPTANVDVVVPHTLGRAALGQLATNLSVATTVYKSPTKNPYPETQVILRASAPVTADLLVF